MGQDRPVSAFTAPLSTEQRDIIADSETTELSLKRQHDFAKDAPLRIHPNSPNQDHFSFLFGGIGDARHLFTSLQDLLESCESPNSKRFHFTMVDIKAVVIARDLVMFYIFKHCGRFTKEQMKIDMEAIEVNSSLSPLTQLLIYFFVYLLFLFLFFS
jgi:Domain of unknown function (DUF4470)